MNGRIRSDNSNSAAARDILDPEKGVPLPPPDDSATPYFVATTEAATEQTAAWGCGCHGAVPPPCSGKAATTTTSAAAALPWQPDLSGFLIVRLAAGLVSDKGDEASLQELAKTFPELASVVKALDVSAPLDADLDGAAQSRIFLNVQSPQSSEYLPSWPLIRNGLADAQGVTRRLALQSLERKTGAATTAPGPSLLLYWRVDCRQHPELLETIWRRLATQPTIDLVYREFLATDPQTDVDGYRSDQSFLDPAPVGLGVRRVRHHVPPTTNNTKIRIVDLEQRWLPKHEELPNPLLAFGDNRHTPTAPGNHGTAVLGQLVAGNQRIEGIATEVLQPIIASHYDHELRMNGNVAEAIIHVLGKELVAEGELLLLEVQRSGLPTEVDVADATAIHLATALGVTVIEAAGNGGFDLDAYRDELGHPVLQRGAYGFRDTGAVLVGAAHSELPHNRAAFSNYGTRVGTYAWGLDVLTAGYGNFDNGAGTLAAMYTHTFSGTSSAAPCVAGAAALIQALYRQANGRPMAPLALRARLEDPTLGTPQGPEVAGFIGIMPDLEAHFRSGDLCPQLTLRRSLADDRVHCQDTACACPDIFALDHKAKDPTTPPTTPGGPAPGSTRFLKETNAKLFVDVRNRGLGPAKKVTAQLYASEVRTFIGPEDWRLIGTSSPLNSLPQGDLPVRLSTVSWNRSDEPAQRYAFLAVLSAEGHEAPPLPTGHCFDLDEYLAFLRRSEVGCRNGHRITVNTPVPPADRKLNFLLTGAPDRSRVFDLELLQNLPKGTAVILKAPPAVAHRLRLTQPWLGPPASGQSPVELQLPPDPSLRFDGLTLPAGIAYPLTLVVPATQLRTGHSLVLRQLHEGREVGRISWFFEQRTRRVIRPGRGTSNTNTTTTRTKATKKKSG